ncbi:MAG: ComEC/Rec2 family competence protein [Armatimonadota bacterium]
MRGARLAVALVSATILLVALISWFVLSRSVIGKQTIPVKTTAFALCGGTSGSASWIKFSGGQVVVIGSGADADADASKLIESLDAYGIRTIDLVILPHPYSDVTAGFNALQNKFRIRQVWVSSVAPINRHNEQAMDSIKSAGIPMSIVHRGDRMQLGELEIDVLSPPLARISGRPSAGNNSVVVRLNTPTFSLLHLGGIGISGQNALLRGVQAQKMKSNIVVLPRVSSSDVLLPEILHATDAEYYVVEGQSDNLDTSLLQKSSGTLVDVSTSKNAPLFFLDELGIRQVL